MHRRAFVVLAVLGAGVAGVLSGQRPPAALADRACPVDRAIPLPLVAIADGEVVGAAMSVITGGNEPSTLRHVAAGVGGTAVVRDRVGADDVVVSTQGSTTVIRQRGEASHPSWSRDGALAWGVDDRLVIRNPDGATRSVAGPRPGGLLVAPVFDGPDIIAVVSAAPTRAVPEDEWSDDLWRYQVQANRWTRITSFPADADRWTVIRTPMAAPDGAIEFVVVRGLGSQTGLPGFSLWELRDATVRRVGSLHDERYLAGYDAAGARLWNVPDRANARWLIRRETPNGDETIGCGAVAVDPLDVTDPDRTSSGRVARSHVRADTARAEGPGEPIEAAVLVGDFASDVAADVVAQQVARAYGGALPVDVIRGGLRSSIVAPGRWAVVVRLSGTTDGFPELAAFRAAFPKLAAHTWIAVP
ncbi:MAG: hypothetical protein ABJB55_09495 [Actinomycetota bacterium]